MKEEIKQKLNAAKEYVIDHKDDIIAFCATAAVSIATGAVCGKIIGQHVSNTNAISYRNGWQKGMTDFYNRMLTDNVDNAEVVKALVDFQSKNLKK